MSLLQYPIIVIGAGAGGLVVAIGAAKMGKRVLLIERGPYGGDCTNFGCIPSKSLIASAHAAHAIRDASSLGIKLNSSEFNSHGALDRVRNIVQQIRQHEEPESLNKNGVETMTGTASFEDPHTLKVVGEGGKIHYVKGKQIIIAAGSHPHVPDIKGLQSTPYLTNETIFDLKAIPAELVIVGGGPIGCELGQAFQRLGSSVTIIHSHESLLQKEEKEAQQIMQEQFRQEGIQLCLRHRTKEVERINGKIVIQIEDTASGAQRKIEASHLLIASGRRPNVKDLRLEAAGISYTPQGVTVDPYGRTSQKHIWAIGDATGGPLFTHMAENQARTVLTNLLLPYPFKKKLDRRQAVPRVTYTDPEVASVGLSQEHAVKNFGTSQIATYFVPFRDVDRAITTGRTEGFVKIVTKKWSSKILGATIVGPRAGEMLSELTAAMQRNVPLRKLASLIHPYPTYSLAIRKAADQWLSQTVAQGLRPLLGRKKSDG